MSSSDRRVLQASVNLLREQMLLISLQPDNTLIKEAETGGMLLSNGAEAVRLVATSPGHVELLQQKRVIYSTIPGFVCENEAMAADVGFNMTEHAKQLYGRLTRRHLEVGAYA
ncbi:hypothetical protein ACYPKM_02670 [Pseudomonas aeruginosa]